MCGALPVTVYALPGHLSVGFVALNVPAGFAFHSQTCRSQCVRDAGMMGAWPSIGPSKPWPNSVGCCAAAAVRPRSEEHTSELQSHLNLVCRLLLEKKKTVI